MLYLYGVQLRTWKHMDNGLRAMDVCERIADREQGGG